ncbi:uncharacterized protein LOC125490844 [Plutella xylostella]|uniref:uncharacterized protein LOC125490844 n=1 Tax=Plutella xylostella TaxID=51655 RepID=UPI002032A708|nr:uncharacterized protein LOC125490844 [Plutella xylostella]
MVRGSSADPTKVCMAQLEAAEQYLAGIYKLACSLQGKSDPASVSMFRVRFEDLKEMRDLYRDAYTSLKGLSVEESALEQADHNYIKFCEMVYSVKVIAEGFLSTSSGTRVEPRSTQFQLPKINLPSFSGVYTEWPNFIGLFDSLIHNNEGLSSVQKMHYLVGALDREPLALVKHLQLSDGNYSIAYQLLKERYENIRGL